MENVTWIRIYRIFLLLSLWSLSYPAIMCLSSYWDVLFAIAFISFIVEVIGLPLVLYIKLQQVGGGVQPNKEYVSLFVLLWYLCYFFYCWSIRERIFYEEVLSDFYAIYEASSKNWCITVIFRRLCIALLAAFVPYNNVVSFFLPSFIASFIFWLTASCFICVFMRFFSFI